MTSTAFLSETASGMSPDQIVAARLLIHGRVQGVGFRPFIYRLAHECGLGGSVLNGADGVLVDLEGEYQDLCRFQERLIAEAPPASGIEGLLVEKTTPIGRSDFVIASSMASFPPHVRIPQDLAVCKACRLDIGDAANRRRAYPFTTCTECGPRYSIVEALPYDRPNTAMRRFAMCAECRTEYETPTDRRFHAEPIACAGCGPHIALWDHQGRSVAGPQNAIAMAAEFLRRGQIVAVKGLGGFQILVQAENGDAVQRLRQRKNRPTKPLAVMAPSLASAEEIALLNTAERRLLSSPANPIVLADKAVGRLPPVVAPRVGTIGLFLPTTPLHHLLLSELGRPVVATSGNRSEEPIVTDEHEAIRRLQGIADAFLIHDRPIERPVDDSVVRVIAGRPVTFRLARGLAPMPLPVLEGSQCIPMLATGGHLKAALAVWTGKQAILAQHIGDLDHPETRDAFEMAARDVAGLYQFRPDRLACDLHPEYFTTQWACARIQPVHQVQHHHAHAVAGMVEHDLLDREVLALIWDGTGYGLDGTVWGGECLRVRVDSFDRLASLLPFPLSGGEAAVRHPNRAAFGLLHTLLGDHDLLRTDYWPRQLGLSNRKAMLLAAIIQRRLRTPWTSSVGRLFDAVAALVLGIREVTFEGEAALWLEAVADRAETTAYPLPLKAGQNGNSLILQGDWRPMLIAILDDLAAGVGAEVVAARFHNGLARWAAATVASFPFQQDILLAGGCFQNRFLAERTLDELHALNRQVYLSGRVPPGDGGLAVGQLAVAMAMQNLNR